MLAKLIPTKSLMLLLLLVLSLSAFAQKTISGRITNSSTGQPLAGATVAVKGTNTATQTNADGDFSLAVPAGTTTLTVTSVGYASQEISINGRSEVNISMVGTDTELSEVVVTALGIRKEKKALGYSVTEVKGEELTKARSVNIANSLVGKVAGLDIASTASGPGGSTRITIRGNTSVARVNQPLIVVDGIPFNNDNLGSVGEWGGQDQGDGISSLNPDEIETITVLKGGTAAALYGSRASNGAILVTTKSGSKSGKNPEIEFSSNAVAEDLLYRKQKDFQYEYGEGDIPGAPGALLGLKPASANFAFGHTNSYGAKLDGSPSVQFDGVSRPYSAVKDNFSKFYDVGRTLTNTFAVSGGSEKISYRFSMSNLNNTGIVPKNTLNRDNAAVNLNANLSKRFSILMNGKYIREKNKNRPKVSDSPGSANYALWTLPTSLSVQTLKDNKYSSDRFELRSSDNQYVTNPWYATEDFQEADTKERYIGVIEPRFNITDWLFVKGRAGFDKFNRRERDVIPTGAAFELGGNLNSELRDFRETNLDLMLGIDKKISADFAVNALLGGNRMKQVNIIDKYNGKPFNIPFFYDVSNISAASVTTRTNLYEKRINSVYGSADISFRNYLYLNVTGRNDWFSTLAPDKNSIFYPSVGLSVILSDALTLPSSINYLKLRGSWAKTGGDTDPYNLSLTYALTGATLNSPLSQINQSQVPNAGLQPYEVTGSEIGVEARMFGSRLGVDLAVYSRKTTNDIVPASISPASGYTTALFNIGEVTNKGVELLLNYKLVSSGNFSWEPSFNFGYNKSNVVQIYPGLDKLFVEEPRPRVSAIYQVLNQPFAQILGNGFKRDTKGQIIYDASGLPLTEGLVSFGTGVSPWTMGLTNNFQFGAFGLSILVDGKFGGHIYSGTNALAYRYGLHKETLVGRETGIIGEGVTEAGTANTVVVNAQKWYGNLYNFAEPFVYSSDFIKLRQLILSYTIPAHVFAGTPFKSINVSIVGRNLWTIMKHTPIIDPEAAYTNSNAQGQEFAGLPPTRTLGLNVSMKF
jgi:TonB-linked SusC/RagA family outer membrane protein